VLLPAEYARLNVVGAADTVGKPWTTSVTGTFTGFPPAGVKTIVPVYVPASRPVGFTVAVTGNGATTLMPAPTFVESQLPPLAVVVPTVKFTFGLLLFVEDTLKLCVPGAPPPTWELNVSELGLACTLPVFVAAPTTSVTGTVCVPLDVTKLMLPVYVPVDSPA